MTLKLLSRYWAHPTYTYAEATWTQSLPDWIDSHQRTFANLGAVPEIVVPDNLLAGVSKAHRNEPDINPTYQDFATHYSPVEPTAIQKTARLT